MSALSVVGIHKAFDESRALCGVSFEIEHSEAVAVLGPSGCGKSTLLAVIAGLENADQGEVLWDGQSLASTPPHLRNFGLMFQDFALFPHRNVFGNVAFGLQMLGWPVVEIQRRVAEVLELVGLPGFEKRDVNTLSGGEGQRIALARSLAPHPRLLMLDEPLGSLDRNLRQRLVSDLREILRKSQQTALYVTHDQEEAFTIAAKVVVMNTGKVEQIGSPEEIYRLPGSAFVARFLGFSNLFPGEIINTGGFSVVDTPLGRFPAPVQPAGPVNVLLRPEALHIGGQSASKISGLLLQSSFRGSTCQLQVDVNGIPIAVEVPSYLNLPKSGETVHLSFESEQALQFFPISP